MNYEPTTPIINFAMFFEEILDVLDVDQHFNTKERVLEIWSLKSDWITRDISEIQPLFNVAYRRR
jgi:hypothetical protein